MNEYKRLKDVFKLSTATPYWASWTAQGIFTALKTIAPWEDGVNEARLNDMYGLSRQNKILSPLAYSIYFEVTYPEIHKLDTPTTTLAEMAMVEFGEKWTRLWALKNAEYNPLENYNMIETGGDSNIKTGSITRTDTGTVTDTHTGTDTSTHTGTDTLSKTGTETHTKTGSETHTGTDTTTHTGTDTLVKSGSETHSKTGSETHSKAGSETTTNTVTSNNTGTTNSVYGFNSSVAVPSDTSSGTQTGLSDSQLEFANRVDTDGYVDRVDTDGFTNRQDQQSVNLTDQQTVNLTDGFVNRVDTDGFTNREDTQTKNLTDQQTLNLTDGQTRNLSAGETYNNVTDTGSHTLSRSGNIGVTTSQQMAESEIDLWTVFDFFEIVFKDIDSILLLDIY